MANLKIGDVCFSRANGRRPMLVIAIRGDGWIDTMWSVAGLETLYSAFPRDGLRRANWFDHFCVAFGG